MKNRAALRNVVNLGARAEEEHIRREIIELQEDTVVAALDILHEQPGVLLADEVGMGKTFQTLAIIACLRHKKPEMRALIVAPTRELCEQWYWMAQRFGAHGFADMPESILATARSLRELPELAKKHALVFAPVDAFAGSRATQDRGFFLSLWAKKARVPKAKLAAIRSVIKKSGLEIGESQAFMGRSLEELAKKPMKGAFARPRGESRGFLGLDDLWKQGLGAFENRTHVRQALDRARYHAVGALLTPFDLLVVDEAHKFKDPWTVRSQAVTHVLSGNYDKAVFLTATPFQLGMDELRQVFRLFGGARKSTKTFEDDVERLLESVRLYQSAYDRFEQAWRLVDGDQEEAFRGWADRFAAAPDKLPSLAGVDDPNVAALIDQAWQLIQFKRGYVEPAFRKWTLRSLKPARRERRNVREWTLKASDASALPLLLYQRLVFEQTRNGGLQKVAADLSISSSYQAAEQSRLLTETSASAAAKKYKQLLVRAIRETNEPHPKIEAVVDEILSATAAGEKTLVFCERNASIRELQQHLEEGWNKRQAKVWNEVCAGYSFEQIFGGDAEGKSVRGVRQKIPPRFYRGNDELSVTLQESLPFALFSTTGMRAELPRSFWDASSHVIETANQLLAECRVPAVSALRPDFTLASRCIDQAATRWFLARNKDTSRLEAGDHALIEEILDETYPTEGSAYLRGLRPRERTERLIPQWTITRAMFDTILSPRRPGIWIHHRRQLGRLSPVVRRMTIEAVRYFLTRREVAFLVEVLARAGGPSASSGDLRGTIEIWWQQETCVWRRKVQELLEYLPCLTEAEQQAVLKDMLRSPRVVQNSLVATSRMLRQNTFNAPFYPMVLIGNSSIQQGLDLHRQCRRVVHYDLRWNPSDLEQRIGRIERHGCLAERFDPSTPEGKLQVIFPLLEQTSDQSSYRDVRLRERWMDFLLGNPPTALQQDASSEAVQPIPASLVGELKVRLGPPRCD